MLAFILALQVATQPITAVAPAPVTPPPAVSRTAGDPPPKTLEERLADLHVLWTQTCGNRAYGAYDDLCQNLGDEIRRAERDARKAKLMPRPAGVGTPVTGGTPPLAPPH